jgi:hypothetical protein
MTGFVFPESASPASSKTLLSGIFAQDVRIALMVFSLVGYYM